MSREQLPTEVSPADENPHLVLHPREADLLHRLAHHQVTCPHCEDHPLIGEPVVSPVYTGVWLACLHCGFREY